MTVSKAKRARHAVNNTTLKRMAIGAAGLFIASVVPADAQSTLGGAKTQQNKIGGMAKPPPVIGGATIHTPSPPTPPKPVVNMARPGSTGVVTPNTTANAAALGQAGGSHPNPPLSPPNRSGPGSTANLKCASGACMSRGSKP
jgi:hypothetical protein